MIRALKPPRDVVGALPRRRPPLPHEPRMGRRALREGREGAPLRHPGIPHAELLLPLDRELADYTHA